MSADSTWDELQDDPENANKGTRRGEEMLSRSVRQLGAGRSILAAADGTIIAGNKTAAAARKQGIKPRIVHTTGDELVVVMRDDLENVDSPRARDLAYADNRVGEVNLNWDLERLKADWESGVDLSAHWNERELAQKFAEFDKKKEAEGIDDLSEELAGVQALKPWINFDSEEPFDIPPLKPDMLGEMPEPIRVWAGRDASDLDFPGWWLYCYGSDSIRGLDMTRTVMAFYVDDYRFEPWWNEPDRYVGRLLNARVPLVITPNFSLWYAAPRAYHVWNTFRARWLGRYMQEAGIKVIPDINWADHRSFEFCLAGVPLNPPCISIQVQTVKTDQEKQRMCAGFERVLTELEPQALLMYGGGLETKAQLMGLIPDDLPLTWLDSRAKVRDKNVMSKSIADKAKEEVS